MSETSSSRASCEPAILSVHLSLSTPALDAFQLQLTPLNFTPTFARTERPSGWRAGLTCGRERGIRRCDGGTCRGASRACSTRRCSRTVTSRGRCLTWSGRTRRSGRCDETKLVQSTVPSFVSLLKRNRQLFYVVSHARISKSGRSPVATRSVVYDDDRSIPPELFFASLPPLDRPPSPSSSSSSSPSPPPLG